MNDYSEYSTPELVRMLGVRFKDYRLRANMTLIWLRILCGCLFLGLHLNIGQLKPFQHMCWQQTFGKYFVLWIHSDISFLIRTKNSTLLVYAHTWLYRWPHKGRTHPFSSSWTAHFLFLIHPCHPHFLWQRVQVWPCPKGWYRHLSWWKEIYDIQKLKVATWKKDCVVSDRSV